MSQIMILLYHCLPICIVPISPIMYSNNLYFPKLLYTALYPCPFCLQYLFWLFCIIIGHPSWMPSILTRFCSLYSCIFNPLRFHAPYFILSFFNCPVKNVEDVKLSKGGFKGVVFFLGYSPFPVFTRTSFMRTSLQPPLPPFLRGTYASHILCEPHE